VPGFACISSHFANPYVEVSCAGLDRLPYRSPAGTGRALALSAPWEPALELLGGLNVDVAGRVGGMEEAADAGAGRR
jgi:hypothetical protein